MLAASFIAALLWLSTVALIFLVFLAVGDWIAEQDRRRRRDLLRERRRYMDSLPPKPWVKP